MKAKDLYSQLEKDFINSYLSDDWARFMGSVADYLSENFKIRSMGLVCDFTDEIDKVFTAVFPSDSVMKRISATEIYNAMLFVHHPSIWDITRAPEVFYQMKREFLEIFKERKIAIYNLHVPLDNYGKYSTSVCFANALKIKPVKPFAPYFGALAGVIGKTGLKTIHELKSKFEKAAGHNVAIYQYGDNVIKDGMTAVVAGGGLVEAIEEAVENKVNVFLTGISFKNDISSKAHEFARQNKINILGGTHYSTESFACREMVNYFSDLGLAAEFLEDIPCMKDL